jgi:23S rRNA (pseudouridine1915-N3)-methyltransferase
LEIRFVAVGKIKERGLRELLDDYYGRVKRYGRFTEVELQDGDAAEVRARFEKAIPDRARVIALEVLGKRMTSEGLARVVEAGRRDAVPSLVFLVGGAYGLPPEVSKAAHIQLSLSDMTLPHRLARLMLAEQVYRAFTILGNEPYSH